MPYRTAEEVAMTPKVDWESAWLSYRERVLGDYNGRKSSRDFFGAMAVAACLTYVYVQKQRMYRTDMKLFYLTAPDGALGWSGPGTFSKSILGARGRGWGWSCRRR